MSSVNEKLADKFKTHQLYLLRLDADERRKVDRLLSKVAREIEQDLADLSGVLRIGEATPNQIIKSEFWRRTLKKVKGHLRNGYGEISDLMSADLLEIADNETKYLSRAITSATEINLADNVLSENYLRNVINTAMIEGAPTKEWWKRQGEKTLMDFQDAVRQGLIKGEGMTDITRRVIGTKKNPGVMSKRKKSAGALVRSSVQAVTNKTRLETLKRNNDVVKGIQWVSTLDNRTSLFCMSMDGLVWDLDYNPIGHGNEFIPPPAHWNCRSTTTPVLKSFEELGIDAEDVPKSTRSSMDGQIPSNEDFGSWLDKKESQDPGFSDKVLGKGRADLWRKGKISISELTDFKGHVLTLEELKNSD